MQDTSSHSSCAYSPTNDHRNLSIAKLFLSDLQRIGLAIQLDHHWSVHTAESNQDHTETPICDRRMWNSPDLQGSCSQNPCLFIFSHVLRGDALGLIYHGFLPFLSILGVYQLHILAVLFFLHDGAQSNCNGETNARAPRRTRPPLGLQAWEQTNISDCMAPTR